jgi:hypothetical protein
MNAIQRVALLADMQRRLRMIKSDDQLNLLDEIITILARQDFVPATWHALIDQACEQKQWRAAELERIAHR